MSYIASSELDQVVEVMKLFSCPWFIAGGWALDLALGKQTRLHQDVDVCCFRDQAEELMQFFSEWEKQVAVPEEHRYVTIRNETDWLPPRHELQFQKKDKRIEVLLIDREGEYVLFRREPSIRYPIKDFLQVDLLGRPYVPPSWQLLFKAKNPISKDQDDFFVHAPALNWKEKQWLLSALRIHQPTSKWIQDLEEMLSQNR